MSELFAQVSTYHMCIKALLVGVASVPAAGPQCGRLARAPRLTVLDEPLQGDVDVVLLLARDGVAADLAVLDR